MAAVAQGNEEYFGIIRPSLIKQLRSVLDQYPDDGQILKELIQNAEDAKASKVCFLFDETQHDTNPDALVHPGLGLHQGPALYAFNDAVFEEKDWQGIRMLQDSIKKTDSLKVGRFGLGFKSVFHMTDMPSVLSDKWLAFIDPHEKYFRWDGDRTTGMRYMLSSFGSDLKSCSGQFEPFKGIFGCDEDALTQGHFNGTLFRFPLRQMKSPLSNTLYSRQKILELFASFQRDAHLVLLFLKHVESVELCIRSDHSQVETLFKVQLQDLCRSNVRAARLEFLKKLSPNSLLNEPAKVVYRAQVETLKYEDGEITQKNAYPLLISEYCPSGDIMSADLKVLCSDQSLSNIPLVGVALQLEDVLFNEIQRSPSTSANSGSLRKEDDLFDPEGQVFCGLPLPVEQKSSTGLPVHVNGFFSVSQNRRHLKWPSLGQDIHSDKEILWNMCLLMELLPQAYINLVLKMVHLCKNNKLCISPDRVMLVLPNKSQVEARERWQVILEPFYKKIFKCKIFHSLAEGAEGHWLSIAECVLDCLKEPAAMCSVITTVLLRSGIKIVKLPEHVMKALHVYYTLPLEITTPELVRNQSLKRHPAAYLSLTRDEKLWLLAYILNDEHFTDLEGITLLPTADNNFVSFTASGSSPIYIPSHDHPREVLRGLDHLLLANDLTDTTVVKINKLASEGSLQLEFLNKDIICEQLPKTVPGTWWQKKTITVQREEQPILQWLKAVWDYLLIQMPHLEDLEKLSGLPILVLGKDVTDYQVMPLAMPPSIIQDGAKRIHLNPEVRRSLESLGVHIVSEVAAYVLAHAAVLGNYIRLPLPEDAIECIVTAVADGGQKAIQNFKNQTSPMAKQAMCEFLGKADIKGLSPEHLDILSSLPLFETVTHGDDMTTDFVSIKDINQAAPLSLPEIRIDSKLLDVREDVVRNLALKLGVKILSQAEFLTDVVIPELASNLNTQKLEQTLEFVVGNLQILQQEKSDFLWHLHELRFLSSEKGEYMRATELFDPGVELLRHFFYSEDKFPTGKFAEPDFLVFLRKLGLKGSADIQATDVLNSALKIENLADSENYQSFSLTKKSDALIKHLCQNFNLLSSSTLREQLVQISWMACLSDQPDDFPEKLKLRESQAFSNPCSLLPLEAVPLAGCIAPICESPNAGLLLEVLGLPLRPTISQVFLQMNKIKEAYQPSDKVKYLRIIETIYSYLANENVSEVEAALHDIKFQDWVWHGDGFTSSDQVVLCQTPVDCKPYLYSLPEELQKFKSMFGKLGIHHECGTGTLVTILENIQRLHLTTDQSAAVRMRDIQLAVSILNLLKDRKNELEDSTHQRILVPVMRTNNTDLCLLSIKECTYCDTEWLQQGNQLQCLEFDIEGITMVHPDVPLSTAEALNVPTLISRVVIPDEFSVTGFGQYETLTNRIRSLLESYTDGYSIAKELVQNADDAGASIVKFLYDERSNSDNMTYLLDEGMQQCQGPAFWAFNDAKFSDKDFENIIKLGGATKETDLDKIGKFGLGFNAVYNITDVPSFVSGNHLVIFDPHMTYLRKCLRSKPGIKLDMRKNKTLIRKLPDQFHPYQNIFGCCIDPDKPKEYNGTLFRMPLRTTVQAAFSELSKQTYNKDEMKKLLSLFVRGSESLLLFTQNVSRVELHHLSSSDSDPQLLFAVDKQKMNTITPLSINPNVTFDVLKSCTSYCDSIENVVAKTQEILATSATVQIQTTATKNGHALLDDLQRSVQTTWLLSYVYNVKHSRKSLKDQSGAGLCLYGALAVPLKKNGSDFIPVDFSSLGVKGSVFCHLPLPIHTYLPVHINGSFAIQSNRRHLCELTDDDKYSGKAEWNKFLLENAVSPAYHLLLQDLVLLNQSTMVKYIDFWPDLSAHPRWEPLVRAFYCDKFQDLVMVHDGERHVCLSQAAILPKSFYSDVNLNSLAVEVFKQSGVVHRVISIPDKIMATLHELHMGDVLIPQRYDEERFVLEIFFPHIDKFASELRIQVLLWILKDLKLTDSITSTIRTTACIPASPNGRVLRKPSELIYIRSQAAKLYHEDEGRFAHPQEFNRDKISQVLLEVGLITDFLNWENLIERARSVEQLACTKSDAAFERAKLLLKYLNKTLQHENYKNSGHFQNASEHLKQMKILPLAAKPHGDPLGWRNSEFSRTALVSTDDGYLSSDGALLSTVHPLIDVVSVPNLVQDFLGLQSKTPTFVDVLKQLNSVVNMNLTDICKNGLKTLESNCYRIYSFLNDECQKEQEGTASMEVYIKFGRRACILLGDRFLHPCELAFDTEISVHPFLNALPSRYSEMTSFFEALGVKKHFEPSDYIDNLRRLKERHDDMPLKDTQLQQCLDLLIGLHHSMVRLNVSAQETGIVFVPNTAGVLKPSSELFYNDCPWLDVSELLNFTHADVQNCMAVAAGVTFHTEEVLKTDAIPVPFPQPEGLITSLQKYKDSYPSNQEILGELVRSAENSCATDIHFVLDKREHGTDRTFGDSWKLLQGPALCVYNNSPFTPHDFETMQRLGENGGRNDLCKTVQYSARFNSVYQLTDIPTIMTTVDDHGKILYVSDPLCSYAPGATKNGPCSMYHVSKTLQSSFPDIFPGYLEDHFDLEKGSLFRFPLRTNDMAKKSEISKHVSLDDMDSMLHDFQRQAQEVLLFSNHLESLKLSSIDSCTNKLMTKYAVSANLNDDDKAKRAQFHRVCLEVAEQLKSGEIAIEDVGQQKVEYIMHISDDHEIYEKWQITQVLGFSSPRCVAGDIRKAFLQDNIVLLPLGGVACLLEKRIKEQQCNKDVDGKIFCCNPTSLKTGFTVHINGHFVLGLESGQELWSRTNEEPSFQSKWNRLLSEKIIAEAYVDLLKCIKYHGLECFWHDQTQAYMCSKIKIDRALSAYLKHFPHPIERIFLFFYSGNDWNFLVQEIYSVMGSAGALLFPRVREVARHDAALERNEFSSSGYGSDRPTWSVEWFPLHGKGNEQAYFVSAEDCKNIVLKDALSKCGFNILEVDSGLVKNILKAGVKLALMSPESVKAFFQTYRSATSMCNLGAALPVRIEETNLRKYESLTEILKFCCPLEQEQHTSSLEGTPLLLTNDGMLRVFDSKIPVYLTKYYRLFPKCGDLFLHEQLMKLLEKQLGKGISLLREFTIPALVECLHRSLPNLYYTNEILPRKSSGMDTCSESMLKNIWEFVLLKLECSPDPKQHCIEPLKNWCLLPVRKGGQAVLYKVGRADEVIDANIIPREYQGIMEKLQVPLLDSHILRTGDKYFGQNFNPEKSLDSHILRTGDKYFGQNFTATFNKPTLILSVVYKAFTENEDVPLLIPTEKQLLLKYFAKYVQYLDSCDEAVRQLRVRQLRALPFYQTICDVFIPLSNCAVYVLPEDILTDEMDTWQNRSGIVFLKRNNELLSLFKFMGCAPLSVCEVYRFILAHIEYLSKRARASHIKHLHATYISAESSLSKKERQNLLKQLQDVSFIEDRDGQLHPASYYYDPDNDLFSVMIEDDRLPPKAVGIRQSEWLTLLRQIGLNSTVTPEMCVEFASQIAGEAMRCDVSYKSKALVKHLFSMESHASGKILKKVSSIRFIPPESVSQDLLSIYPQYGDRDNGKSQLPYICFKESYSGDYAAIIWTCANILPKWADPRFCKNGKQLSQVLGIAAIPPISLVAHNFTTVRSAVLGGGKLDREALKRWCMMSYKFLQQYGLENGKLHIVMQEDMVDVPCIAIGGKEIFAKPCYTTFNILEQDEIRPYLCKIPYDYAPYKSLFVALGASEQPTLEQYALALDLIHRETGGKRLTPNELQLTYKALRGLFRLIRDFRSEDQKTGTLFLGKKVDTLSLLRDDSSLCISSRLVYNDAPWLYNRVKSYKLPFLANLGECGVKENLEELLKLLPPKHKPQMLSSSVKEVLKEEKSKAPFVSTGLADEFQKRLGKDVFRQAVERLCQHQAHGSCQKVSTNELQRAFNNLANVNFYATEQITTCLIYKDKVVKGSAVEKKCFVEKVLNPLGIALYNVYVKNDTKLSVELLNPLADILNSIMGGILTGSVIFLPLILACHEGQIQATLDNLGVRSGFAQGAAQAPTLPEPGSVVPHELQDLLSDAQASQLTIGDFVAVLNGENEFVYGIVREILSPEWCRLEVGEDVVNVWSIESLKTFIHRL